MVAIVSPCSLYLCTLYSDQSGGYGGGGYQRGGGGWGGPQQQFNGPPAFNGGQGFAINNRYVTKSPQHSRKQDVLLPSSIPLSGFSCSE